MTSPAWDGRPPNPEVSGYHWLRWNVGLTNPELPDVPARWWPGTEIWTWSDDAYAPIEASQRWTYLGPVAPYQDATADTGGQDAPHSDVAQAVADERERCALIADRYSQRMTHRARETSSNSPEGAHEYGVIARSAQYLSAAIRAVHPPTPRPGASVEGLRALSEAATLALNFIQNTENELGIKLSSGDALRAALAQSDPARTPEGAP